PYRIDDCVRRGVLRQVCVRAVAAELFSLAHLHPDIARAGVVLTDEHRRETRRVPVLLQLLDARDEIGEHGVGDGRARHQGCAQWRKCRSLVKTIATPSSFARSMLASSFTEPPGWMMTATPASAAASMPSGNG